MARRMLIVLAILLFVGAVGARADLTLPLNYVFSGAAPSGSLPWGTATFSNVTATSATLTLATGSGWNAAQFVGEWLLNSSATITGITYSSGVNGTVLPWEATGPGCGGSGPGYRADGDGCYNFGFEFATNAFNGNETSVWSIVGSGLSESAFDTLSVPGGGAGTFHTAAHIQGIPTGQSGWVGDTVIPEPYTTFFGLLAVVGLISGRAIKSRFSRT